MKSKGLICLPYCLPEFYVNDGKELKYDICSYKKRMQFNIT